MGFFSKDQKKEDKVRSNDRADSMSSPNLPTLPELPQEIPEIKMKSFALPSMPNSRSADQFNRASVKDAVTTGRRTQEISEIPEMRTLAPRNPPRNQSRGLPPMMSYPPEPLHEPRSIEMSEWDSPETHTMPAQPLFIKLDTFERAISSFNEIKLKISEIESLQRNIREIKNREEAELSEWEREIEGIKARLEQINHDIFSKIE